MRFIILIIAIVALSGCANTMRITCPDCTLTNDTFVCEGCSVTAQESQFSGNILKFLPPLKDVMRNPPAY